MEFLARSLAKVAGVPQVAADEAAEPPVVADKAAVSPVAADEASALPGVADKASAYCSWRWRRNRRKASSTLHVLETVPEPVLPRDPHRNNALMQIPFNGTNFINA